MLTLVATVILTLGLIQKKHLVVDWIWQPPYEFENKGTYGHWGGVRHALKNAIGTGLCVFLGFHGLAGLIFCAWIAALDFVIHYHIDWGKMNLNARYGLKPCGAPFWWAVGADQYLHQITYLGLVWYTAICVASYA